MGTEDLQRRKHLTEDEAQALLAAVPLDTEAGLRNLAMIALMLDGGLKVSELVGPERTDADRGTGGLRIGDISWNDKTVRVTRPKDGTSRTLALSADTLELIRRWLNRRPVSETDLVFTSLSGGRLQNRYVRQFLSEYGERAGIGRRVKPSVLRHTFAGRIFRETGDLEKLRDLLGHRDISATARYAHRPPDTWMDGGEGSR